MGLILMFIVNFLFSVLFPTTDVGSDVYLAHQTLHFVGDNLVLQGCRSCFHNDESYIVDGQKNGCTTCFTFVPTYRLNEFDYPENNDTQYLFSFGTDYCQIPILDKILDLQSNSKNCNETFQERNNFNSEVGQKRNIWLEPKECDSNGTCCIERVKDLKYTEFDTPLLILSNSLAAFISLEASGKTI